MHRQQVHEALREPQEEHLVVDDFRPGRLLRSPARIVQEHEVEIRSVAELHAAELAVARDRDPRGARPPSSRSAARRSCATVCRQASASACSTISSATSVSRSLTCISGSRPVRSSIATRNVAARRNWRSASTCRSSSLAGVLEPRGEFLRELGAIRQRLEDARVEQLVEQQRMRGDLRAR